MSISKCSSNPSAFRDISDLEAENKEIYFFCLRTHALRALESDRLDKSALVTDANTKKGEAGR